MKRSLIPTVMGQPISPQQESPVEKANKTEDNFICGKGCSYKLDTEQKKVHIWIYGVISSTQNLMKVISLLHIIPNDFTVFIHIHSPGGSVPAACNLLTAMERCKATIITHNMGMAASCGSLILTFGDKIAIDPLSITMFHNAAGGRFDTIHRVETTIKHTISRINDIFRRLADRGIIDSSEIDRIVSNGEEFFIPSNVIIDRLRNNNLLYEGDLS